MVGVASIGNAFGRVFWAWISDSITRRAAFIVMFAMQVLLFWNLPGVATTAVLTGIAFTILMCYGGGFGTMPAFTADYFGSKNVGSIYGLMLTAWGAASAFGPLLDCTSPADQRQLPQRASHHRGTHVDFGNPAAISCRRRVGK